MPTVRLTTATLPINSSARTKARRILLFLALLLGAKCGGHAVALDQGALLTTISPEQGKLFCDWLAQLYGGYGQSLVCDSGQAGITGYQDQGTCTNQLAQGFTQPNAKYKSCPATVGQVQTCLQWGARNACVASPGPPPDVCAVAQGPKCAG
jgi:hypothetical protein